MRIICLPKKRIIRNKPHLIAHLLRTYLLYGHSTLFVSKRRFVQFTILNFDHYLKDIIPRCINVYKILLGYCKIRNDIDLRRNISRHFSVYKLKNSLVNIQKWIKEVNKKRTLDCRSFDIVCELRRRNSSNRAWTRTNCPTVRPLSTLGCPICSRIRRSYRFSVPCYTLIYRQTD